MIVATVLRTGGGTYDHTWVYALKRGLTRHGSTHPFRVLTDSVNMPAAWGVRLKHDWPGWWAKCEAFRPGVFPEGELVLYVDLDTLPVGDLSVFEAYEGDLAVLSDFYRPQIIASGVMLFRPGERTAAIYEAFCKDPEGIMAQHTSRSDYWYATTMGKPDRIQDVFPERVVSFKAHARDGVPDGASIVAFHGNPRPNDPRAGWAYGAWLDCSREAA